MRDLKKKCLIMIPRTWYSYPEYFLEAFISLGYSVTISNDEYPDSIIGKLMGKLHIPLLLSITNKVITERFLKDKTYDLVIIIQGRGMSIPLLKKMKQNSTKIVGYNYDSFEYSNASLKWIKYVSKYFTFDYRDAEVHNLPVAELFSCMHESSKPKTCKYELSAMGRNHSKRLKFIDSVLSNISTERKFIYIFERNVFTFFQNFINNPFLYIKYKKYIHFKFLPYKDFAEVLINSNFVIDFAHPAQTGITIRCFEALSTQTKIITNNPFISRNKHFNDSNTIIHNNSYDATLLKEHYSKICNQIPPKYSRTIYHFINDLIL